MTHPPICERCGNDYAEVGHYCRGCIEEIARADERAIIAEGLRIAEEWGKKR